MKNFEHDALNIIWDAMDSGNAAPPIKISIGSASIEIDTHADSFQALIEFLEAAKND